MIYRDKEGLKLSNKKVVYIQHGEQMESFVTTDGVEWWVAFADKWDHTQIIEIIDVIYTPEQLARFEEVKDMEAGENILNEYMLNGTFPDDLKNPLRNIQAAKENADLWYENIMMSSKVTTVEQEIADLWYEIVMGGM